MKIKRALRTKPNADTEKMNEYYFNLQISTLICFNYEVESHQPFSSTLKMFTLKV